MGKVIFVCEQTEIFHLFSSFLDFFPCCSFSIFLHRAHILRSILWCDLMSSVWRIQAGALGVASVSWKTNTAASKLFMFSFESPKIVWIIFPWIISLQIGPKAPRLHENQLISLIIFYETFIWISLSPFLATHRVILSARFKRWLSHTASSSSSYEVLRFSDSFARC